MANKRPRGPRGLNFRLVAVVVLALAVMGFVLWIVLNYTQTYYALIASTDITAGSAFDETDYTVVEVQGAAPKGEDAQLSALMNPEEAPSYYGLLATSTIHAGSVIQVSDFYAPRDADEDAAPADQQAYVYSFSELLGKDERAVVIVGDPTSTFVSAGDFVDIIWVGTDQAKKMFTKQVIYVRQVPAAAEGEVQVIEGTEFVLELSAQEAQDIAWAQAHGELRIALANPESGDEADTELTDEEWFSKYLDGSIPNNSATDEEPSESPSEEPVASPGEDELPLPSDEASEEPEASDEVPALPSSSPETP